MKLQHLHAVDSAPAQRNPCERIFDHWVFMLGKPPKRVALGPARRKVIERALSLYDEETLLLAIEGCAASRWHAGDNDRRKPFDDIELILRDEPHIERFAADGEALRLRVLREEAADRVRAPVQPIAPEDAAAVARRRELVAQAAARLAGRAQHG